MTKLYMFVYIYSLPSSIKDTKGYHIDLVGIVYVLSQIKYNISMFLNKTYIKHICVDIFLSPKCICFAYLKKI